MIHQIFLNVFHAIIPVAHAAEAASASGSGSGSALTLLGIDWKLFVAQLINFSIVLFVLWKWVFGPVGKKLQERTDKIEKSVEQAKEIEAKLKETESLKQAEIEKARKEASDIIAKAQTIAGQARDQIMEEAQKASQKLMDQTKQQIADEKAKLMREVREEAAGLVVMATEKILKEKLTAPKDQELIKESLKGI